MLLAGVVQLTAGAIRIGVSLDEPTQVMRLQGWIGNGWYVPPAFLVDGDPRPIPQASPFVYGPAYEGIAHTANMIVGNESRGEVSNAAGAWETRHLVVAAIGLLTAAAAGFAVWLLTASRRFALWGAAALLAFPIWLGMSFFNPKDVPVAAGYTLFTVGLLLALGRGRRLPAGKASAVAVAALLAVGFFLAAGTRPALWAALLASAATFALLAWARARFGGAGPDWPGTGSVLAGIAIGILAVAVSYPAVFAAPLDLLTHSISDSTGFAWSGLTLTAGRLLPDDPPWWYLPVWVFASSPVLLLALSLVGAVSPFGSVVGAARGRPSDRLRAWLAGDESAVLLVLVQALLMPVGSVVVGANMYSGLRQHLYVVPALAILAGVGAFRAWRHVSRAPARRWSRPAVALLVSAALVLPMVEAGMLFPYGYTYINPIAGLGGINGRWETDYWWTSSREALSRLPAAAHPYCGALNEPTGESQPFLADCSLAPMIGPYLGERDGAPIGGRGSSGGFVWALSGNHLVDAIPAGCRRERDVTRWLRGEEVLMSYVLTCDPALARRSALPPAGIPQTSPR